MSVNGPTLGTLLVQRIDAALGIATSQQTNIANGARPDAVSQAAEAAKLDQLQNPTSREPRENVDRAQLQNEQQVRQAIERGKLEAQKGLLKGTREGPSTTTTPSAPTTLGNAARTILSLLTTFPQQPAPVQGRQPLVSPFSDGNPNTANQSQNIPSGTASGPGSNPAATTASAANPGSATNANNPAGQTTGSQGSTNAAANNQGSTQATTNAQGNPVISMAMTAQRTSPQAFMQALANALQSSGLFYESHLAELAFGKTQAQTVRQEPQAQLHLTAQARTAQHPAATDATPQSNAASSRAESGSGPSTSSGSTQASASASSTGTQTSAQPGATTTLAGLHPESHLMVRQQLEVLANQTIAWKGEAWPDAKMDWEIQRREPDHDADPESQTHWATRIRLQLPHLGEIDVRINLVDNRVLLHAVAPQSAQTLSEHRDMLRTSFDASGLTLSQFVIDRSAEAKENHE